MKTVLFIIAFIIGSSIASEDLIRANWAAYKKINSKVYDVQEERIRLVKNKFISKKNFSR
jgi:hypothetical protein